MAFDMTIIEIRPFRNGWQGLRRRWRDGSFWLPVPPNKRLKLDR